MLFQCTRYFSSPRKVVVPLAMRSSVSAFHCSKMAVVISLPRQITCGAM